MSENNIPNGVRIQRMWAVFATVLGVLLVLLLGVLTVATTEANIKGDAQETERFTTCVESGGSWIAYTEDCIAG